jgi:hypothetical protein
MDVLHVRMWRRLAQVTAKERETFKRKMDDMQAEIERIRGGSGQLDTRVVHYAPPFGEEIQ